MWDSAQCLFYMAGCVHMATLIFYYVFKTSFKNINILTFLCSTFIALFKDNAESASYVWCFLYTNNCCQEAELHCLCLT